MKNTSTTAAGGEVSDGDDYALTRVPDEARYSWFSVAVQRFGQVSALAQFLLGATLGYGMTFWNAFWALTVGAVILEVARDARPARHPAGPARPNLGGVLDVDHRAPPRQRLGDHEGSGRGHPNPDPAVVQGVEHLAVPAVLVLQHEHEPGSHQHRCRYT